MDDVDEGEANGVNATPTFYINNKPTNVRSEAQWRAALDAALREAASPAPTTATSTN
jgi:protein-disulfide isomerase